MHKIIHKNYMRETALWHCPLSPYFFILNNLLLECEIALRGLFLIENIFIFSIKNRPFLGLVAS